MRIAGFVLTGGRSSRMGRDKALLQINGMPLAARIASALEQATGAAFLVGGADRYSGLGWPVLDETHQGDGPLSGIEAALGSGIAEWSLIVACDMPGLEAPVLASLAARTAETSASIVAVSTPVRRLEPLCAAYHASLHPAVVQALFDRRLAVQDLLESIATEAFPVSISDFAANVNTPEDWAAWPK